MITDQKQTIASTLHSLPMPKLNDYTRQDILNYFHNTWSLTEALFSGLKNDDAFYQVPYHQLRHPLIFYYAHPVVLYVNKLRLAGLLDEPVNAYFEKIFETGVDEMRWDDLSKNQMQWPTVSEVKAYRKQVYDIIHHIITTHPGLNGETITMDNPLWALFMGFEHERIHLETSSVLMRELPISFLKKPSQWPAYYRQQARTQEPIIGKDYPRNQFKEIITKTVKIGKEKDYPTYGWDNEYGTREVRVNEFKASQFLISNGEFLEFVKSGGYQEKRYWSEAGWQWRTFRNIKWPTFWVPIGPAGLHQYDLRLIFDVVPMQWSYPVNVNYHEAKAYCAWRSEQDNAKIPYRLLTEAEHHALRDEICQGTTISEREPQDNLSLSNHHSPGMANINLTFGAEIPVNASKPSQAGFYDVFGNVWQWCEDHFAALPGFEVHQYYDDFSAPCFDGEHQIIMGGSFISTGDEATAYARFHFRPHFFQHAGFRLVAPLTKENKYESQPLLNQYLLLHYGDAANTCSFAPFKEALAFPKRCADLLIQLAKQHHVDTNNALDLGCAVGGASFELAREFKHVLGIDLSEGFIAAANQLKQTGEMNYLRKEQGNIHMPLTARIEKHIDKNHVTFQVGDACALPADLPQFDAVLLANLLCRLPNPRSLFARLTGERSMIKPGGLLMITSPYSWLEEFTPASAWLGGKIENGNMITPIQALHDILDNDYELIHDSNMPLIIREHARKFEYIIAHATIWKRK